jgi:amino acid transporter
MMGKAPMQPTPDDETPGIQHKTASEKPRRSWRTVLIGNPLATAEAAHESINKVVGLAVFASDALSSTAYATQEMLAVLAAVGMAAFGLAVPLSFAIVILLAIVVASYEQTIHAYPNGGGAYIVARDNLGELPSATAGAALLIDYTLTVAVSISSGVAQIVSAAPDLSPYRVPLAVSLALLIMVVNLRGVRESGTIFAIPTYFFVAMMFITVGLGFFRFFTGTLGTVVDPPPMEALGGPAALSLFLILRAFSSGTTALTGVEAISNGVPAFREPKSRNAGITLLWMAGILAVLLLSITFLSVQIGAVPSEEETVISQLARTADGERGILYLLTIAGTTVILIMAANTSYNGFPRLGALLAQDGFLPRQLAYQGSRLVYSRGIVALGLFAAAFIIVFRASVTALIPLYAIGVFLSFSLSQGGMARRWYKTGHMAAGQEIKERGSVLRYEEGWQSKMVINAIGAFLTGLVMIVFAVTKFSQGAWIVLILMPVLIAIFFRIHRHYRGLAQKLSLVDFDPRPPSTRHRVILPISGVHRGTLEGLRYALLLSHDVTAVHVSIDAEAAARVEQRWETWGEGVRLVILDSPYRLMLEPLLQFIEQIAAERQPNETITIVVPQFVPKTWFDNLLHTQTALILRLALLFRSGIVVVDVPYQVD